MNATEAQALRAVHRVVLPTDGDPDVLPLYVDTRPMPHQVQPEDRSFVTSDEQAEYEPLPPVIAPASDIELTGRRSLALPAHGYVSFGTYMNAFPAAYWAQWTSVSAVVLSVELDAPAFISVYRSDTRGRSQRVDSLAAQAGTSEFTLPLSVTREGGWYWFDIHATAGAASLVQASWSVDASAARIESGSVSIGITTFNRARYCLAQLRQLASEAELTPVIDRAYVIDQGTDLVQDQPGFGEVSASWGDRLTVIRQDNLGGSGGFARNMAETAERGESDYLLLLDDDVLSEPEGILRAVAFADFASSPTLVGGHMFSMFHRARLHAWGEYVDRARALYRVREGVRHPHDFSRYSLRTTPGLHRRMDVDYNAWWMCLIPVDVIREIGLSLPAFIKWDDVEYGWRATDRGFPTVTLPGAAVWHVPWDGKDDSIDWQAYYHQRNRWLSALLHADQIDLDRLIKDSVARDIRHLLGMQYSALELRDLALRDLLSGPAHLHETLASKLGEIRALRATFTDAQVIKDPADLPARTAAGEPKGTTSKPPRNRLTFLARAGRMVVRQLKPARKDAAESPEGLLSSREASWWNLARVDSVVVSLADGSGSTVYVRDPRAFREGLKRTRARHKELRRQWPALVKAYQDAQDDLTSLEAWRATFERHAIDG